MFLKVKVEPFGEPFSCKSGFLRKFASPDGKGGREIITLWSKSVEALQSIKNGDEVTITSTDFFFLKAAA